MFHGTELSTSILFIRHWLLQKVFFWPLTNLKFGVKVCSFLGFPSVEIKSDDGYQIVRRISCDQNFTVALEASLLGQLYIFRTIFRPWALSSDIPAAERGLFTKYPWSDFVSRDQFYPMRARRKYSVGYKYMYIYVYKGLWFVNMKKAGAYLQFSLAKELMRDRLLL